MSLKSPALAAVAVLAVLSAGVHKTGHGLKKSGHEVVCVAKTLHKCKK